MGINNVDALTGSGENGENNVSDSKKRSTLPAGSNSMRPFGYGLPSPSSSAKKTSRQDEVNGGEETTRNAQIKSKRSNELSGKKTPPLVPPKPSHLKVNNFAKLKEGNGAPTGNLTGQASSYPQNEPPEKKVPPPLLPKPDKRPQIINYGKSYWGRRHSPSTCEKTAEDNLTDRISIFKAKYPKESQPFTNRMRDPLQEALKGLVKNDVSEKDRWKLADTVLSHLYHTRNHKDGLSKYVRKALSKCLLDGKALTDIERKEKYETFAGALTELERNDPEFFNKEEMRQRKQALLKAVHDILFDKGRIQNLKDKGTDMLKRWKASFSDPAVDTDNYKPPPE